jgi:hypothetical protein
MKKRTSNIERRTSNVECGAASRSYLVAGIEHRASRIQKRSNRKKEPPKTLELTWGKYAIVDAEDYEKLKDYKWCTIQGAQTFYAKTFYLSGAILAMHRLILDAPKGLYVDHIDHNGLNNRKSNLRLCTNQQNLRNKLPRPGCSSKYKGVSWSKARNKFRANIYLNRKAIHLGYFDSEIDAAKAYDKKAHELFGEFAYLNFPPSSRT